MAIVVEIMRSVVDVDLRHRWERRHSRDSAEASGANLGWFSISHRETLLEIAADLGSLLFGLFEDVPGMPVALIGGG